jgi:hypothetical protein
MPQSCDRVKAGVEAWKAADEQRFSVMGGDGIEPPTPCV